MAQKTQWFWFQISFSFLAITHAFFDENAFPVLESTLQCGSNGMLNLKIGWEITDLHGKMSEVASYTWSTVYPGPIGHNIKSSLSPTPESHRRFEMNLCIVISYSIFEINMH